MVNGNLEIVIWDPQLLFTIYQLHTAKGENLG